MALKNPLTLAALILSTALALAHLQVRTTRGDVIYPRFSFETGNRNRCLRDWESIGPKGILVRLRV